MAAGLKQMVARQSKMAKNHREHRVKTLIDLAVLIRHSLKYKNTVSQKTPYKDTELQIQVLTVNENILGLQTFQREERSLLSFMLND